MTTELQEAPPDTAAPEETDDELPAYALVAGDTTELAAAHKGMVDWATNAIAAVDREAAEESANVDAAVAAGFQTAPFERRLNRLAKRRVFYAKLAAALEEGYVLIPNFEMTTFAIRTKRTRAYGRERQGTGWTHHQEPDLLPAGEGSFKDPNPRIHTRHEQVANQSGTGTHLVSFEKPTIIDEEIDFPLAIAKPQLMQRTAKVMARKLFDEIGVAVDSSIASTRGDPILIGRIRNPRRGRPSVSFFLGWYFDPSRL